MDKIEQRQTYARELAIETAAQCWTQEETKGIVMDVRLASAFQNSLEFWIRTALEFSDNADFYRSIVRQTGQLLGPEAKISDDGSVQQDVLALKVPELVKKLKDDIAFSERKVKLLASLFAVMENEQLEDDNTQIRALITKLVNHNWTSDETKHEVINHFLKNYSNKKEAASGYFGSGLDKAIYAVLGDQYTFIPQQEQQPNPQTSHGNIA